MITMRMTIMTIGVRMLLMEPSALKHWIVAGISLDKAHGSTGIVSADPEWEHRAFVYEEVVEVLERNSIGSITYGKRTEKAVALMCGVGRKSLPSQAWKNSDTFIDKAEP